MNWLFLTLAIVAEVVATSALKVSDGMTRLQPALIVVIGYGLAFYLLGLALRSIPVGLAYGIWAGMGMVLMTLVGWLHFREPLDAAAVVGLGLILAGVAIIQLFSASSVAH